MKYECTESVKHIVILYQSNEDIFKQFHILNKLTYHSFLFFIYFKDANIQLTNRFKHLHMAYKNRNIIIKSGKTMSRDSSWKKFKLSASSCKFFPISLNLTANSTYSKNVFLTLFGFAMSIALILLAFSVYLKVVNGMTSK